MSRSSSDGDGDARRRQGGVMDVQGNDRLSARSSGARRRRQRRRNGDGRWRALGRRSDKRQPVRRAWPVRARRFRRRSDTLRRRYEPLVRASEPATPRPERRAGERAAANQDTGHDRRPQEERRRASNVRLAEAQQDALLPPGRRLVGPRRPHQANQPGIDPGLLGQARWIARLERLARAGIVVAPHASPFIRRCASRNRVASAAKSLRA